MRRATQVKERVGNSNEGAERSGMSSSLESGSQPLLSETDAAKKLGVCRHTLLRARKRGEIGYYRIGDRVLYSAAHLRSYLEASEHSPRHKREAAERE